MTVLNDADNLKLGDTQVDKIYVGDESVWPVVFDPATLSGLTAWFDSSELSLADGALVTTWPDLSNNGHDMSPNLTYGTAPTYKTNERNGLGVVRFNGTSNVLTATAFGTYQHFFAVSKYRLPGFKSYDALISGYTSGHLILLGDGATGSMTSWYAVGGQTYYVNGVDVTSTRQAPMGVWAHVGARSQNPLVNMDFQVGLDRSFSPRFWDGDIAEVIAYDRVLSDPERQQVEDYLRTKWGL